MSALSLELLSMETEVKVSYSTKQGKLIYKARQAKYQQQYTRKFILIIVLFKVYILTMQ